MKCDWRAMYLWRFWSEGVIALFLSVLNRGIVAGRMVPPALLISNITWPRRFYHRCRNWPLAFRGSLINHRLFPGRRRAKK